MNIVSWLLTKPVSSVSGQLDHYTIGLLMKATCAQAAKFRTDAPSKNNSAAELCQAWGGNTEGHFLLARIDGKRLEVMPYGHLKQNELCAIALNPQTAVPFVVDEEERAVSGAHLQ